MTADGLDRFPYVAAAAHESVAARRHYWAVAIGLQDVDGLEVSPYLRDTAQGHIDGAYTIEQAGELVRAHHAAGHDDASREADLVSQRIAELLSRSPFCLAPGMLSTIHRHLFQDLDAAVYHPGEFKRERMMKQEDVLNGDSVLYADPLAYDMALAGAFSAEQAKFYRTLSGDELADFCHTIAFLWQVHPFYEGNTRTVAVFSELYLNHLGFSVTNEPFQKHARYFRDALVRAMYRNADAGVFPNESYLVSFYENVLGQASHPLVREDLLCAALFENPHLLRNVDPQEALDKRRW
ncbi:Fic family protein [Xiamenia xianingshaonis]|uniref:protein adenylyltransferase n=1 Tax=Xiamenia xianingshaonis TaxID=2682776 RepID=A0A9E6SUY1_9ACTN|nr:Fic family protein [Xiamenia xianingshaonis]NHM14554.1 cell filamentation protein Fic [Xiamenia xianingshaonis]QTU84996.1 Fic family protein [Xiamenia xianingshaonis]